MSVQRGDTRPEDRTNTLAIVSFVSSFVISIVGIVTGHMALRQIRRSGEGGRGLAIAGLVIGYVFVGLTVLFVGSVLVGASLATLTSRPATASTMAPPSLAQEVSTPANSNIHGGVTLLANNDVAKSDPTTLKMTDLPSASVTQPPGAEAEQGKPVKVVVYVDFICPVCKNFQARYNESLTQLRNERKITVEYRPLGFLDTRSTTNYSTRAANAAACMANEYSNQYSDFFNALYDKQPAEGSAGLSDLELKKIARDFGAKTIDECVDAMTFGPYVKHSTQEAQVVGVTGTPTVFVEGKQWGKGDSAQTPFDQFLQAAIDAKK